ncbi:hypothetical protein LCGC14_0820490 [marine sediment metagenome]|uniref:J domain-containing protein n=1 Tax=marine sediment metagenome TaxID=412755 RepID=A0A0F9S3X9_9ZZZZ
MVGNLWRRPQEDNARGRGRDLQEIFGVAPKKTTLADVDAIYKSRARKAHPDAGGSEDAIKILNQARTDARSDLEGGRFL